jgi:hypothetical protein
MFSFASILYLAGCIAAANAASSVPVAVQPILSTLTVTAASNAASTSFSTFLSTETVVLYSTLTSRQKLVTSSIGQQLSTVTSTSAVVATGPAELSTIVSTIGSSTLYSIIPSAALPTTTIPPAVVATTPAQTPETTPINVITSTASIPTYSTNVATTSPGLATSAASTNTASAHKTSKKLSSGAAAGIAIGVVVLIGAIAGAIIIFRVKRRREKKWARKVTCSSSGDESESKTNLFSPDARAGYDSMWKKPVVDANVFSASEKEIRPGTANTTSARVFPVTHERGDSSTLGIDAPSIAPSTSSARTPKTDVFGDKPKSPGPWKTVPNFSTPNRRSMSITALPKVAS